jgi:hypothetical protein
MRNRKNMTQHPSDIPRRIYPAFDANLAEAREAVVCSAPMFRFEFSDNLKCRHLPKIESIGRQAETQGRRANRGQRILKMAARHCSRETEISPCPANRGAGPRAKAATGRTAAPL